MKHVCCVIRQLNQGGAQRQILVLADRLSRENHRVSIVTFYDGGDLSPEVPQHPNITVISVNKRSRYEGIRFTLRLFRTIQKLAPDTIYSFLPVSNILCALYKWLHPATRLVWGVRGSKKVATDYDALFRLSLRIERRLASLPDALVANSKAGVDLIRSWGVPARKIRCVFNGIDTTSFRPDPEAGLKFKARFFHSDEKLVGLIGRLDPMKGHEIFLRAAALVQQEIPNARFLCIGSGTTARMEELRALSRTLALAEKALFLDFQSGMPAVYNALDVAVSASLYGEGFPNAVAEAMACGRPCVVTNVGEGPAIVGDPERAVPPGDPAKLAAAIKRALQHHQLPPQAVHESIEQRFGIGRMVSETRDILWPKG